MDLILFLKRYADDDCSWRTIQDSVLSEECQRRFLLECNFDVSKLNITFPCLYKECLNSWTPLVEGQHYPRRGVLLWQSIWNISFNQQLFY